VKLSVSDFCSLEDFGIALSCIEEETSDKAMDGPTLAVPHHEGRAILGRNQMPVATSSESSPTYVCKSLKKRFL
jgi:hypothetical protein